MLDADGETDRVLGHAGLVELGGRELAVGGGRGMRRQGAHVADVDQAGEELERVEEARAALAALPARALEAEGDDAGGLAGEVLADQRVVGVVLESGVVDPADLVVALQMLGERERVVADAIHPKGERLYPLEDEEGVEGGQRGAGVAQRDDAGAADVGGGAQGLGVDDAVVAGVGLVQALEAFLVLGPGELAGVDDGAADGGAVAAQVLGQRVHDDVGAVLEGAAEIGRGNGVVDDQGDAVVVGDLGDGLDVGDVALRVAEGLDKDGLCLGVDEGGEGLGLAVVGEAGGDAVLRKGVGQQVVGPPIEGAGGEDVVAGLGDGEDGVGDGGLAGGYGERAYPAFEGGEALLEHVVGGIHNPAVDVAGDLEVEEVGAVLGGVEGVGGGLVDGDGDGLGGGVGGVAGVDGPGFEAPGGGRRGLGHGALLVDGRGEARGAMPARRSEVCA